MRHKQPSKMRDLRKAQDPPLTLTALARNAGVSYTTCWNLENGAEEKVDVEIKRRVAEVLGTHAELLFQSENVRAKREELRRELLLAEMNLETLRGLTEIPEEQRRLLSALGLSHWRGSRAKTLVDFCPDLKDAFEYKADVEDIIDRMTLDELGDLFHSGLSKEEAIDHLARAALRLGLKAPELKK